MNKTTIMYFMNDLIAFLDEKFAKDNRFSASKKLVGALAFNKDSIKNATKSFYVLRVLTNRPKDETFTSITTLNVNIQIDIYALKGNLGGTQYLAEPMAVALQDVVSAYMQDLKFGDYNQNICLMRETAASPALPFEDGVKAYQSSLRYQFTIMQDYERVFV